MLLNPLDETASCHVSELLNNEAWGNAPLIAVSDYVKTQPEQLRVAIDAPLRVLGTDGFGRSDTREQLRAFFEVDSRFIRFGALTELVTMNLQLDLQALRQQLEIDVNKPNPRTH